MAASRTKISILATARPSFYLPFSGSNLRKFRQKSRGRTSTAPLYRVAVCDRFGGNRRPKLETKSSTDPPKGRGSLSPFRLLVGFLQCWFFFVGGQFPAAGHKTKEKRRRYSHEPRRKWQTNVSQDRRRRNWKIPKRRRRVAIMNDEPIPSMFGC